MTAAWQVVTQHGRRLHSAARRPYSRGAVIGHAVGAAAAAATFGEARRGELVSGAEQGIFFQRLKKKKNFGFFFKKTLRVYTGVIRLLRITPLVIRCTDFFSILSQSLNMQQPQNQAANIPAPLQLPIPDAALEAALNTQPLSLSEMESFVYERAQGAVPVWVGEIPRFRGLFSLPREVRELIMEEGRPEALGAIIRAWNLILFSGTLRERMIEISDNGRLFCPGNLVLAYRAYQTRIK